MRSGS